MYQIIIDNDSPKTPLEARLLRAASLDALGYKFFTEKEEKETPLYVYTVVTDQRKEYTVKFDNNGFSCTCPDSYIRAKKETDGWCKHMLYILTNIAVPEIMAVTLLVHPQLSMYLKKVGEGRRKHGRL